MAYYTYILQCSDSTLYTGVTSNLRERLYQHETGFFPSCYTIKRRPFKLVYYEEFSQILDAIEHEKKFKKWSGKKKWAYINKDKDALKALAACKNDSHFKNNPKSSGAEATFSLPTPPHKEDLS